MKAILDELIALNDLNAVKKRLTEASDWQTGTDFLQHVDKRVDELKGSDPQTIAFLSDLAELAATILDDPLNEALAFTIKGKRYEQPGGYETSLNCYQQARHIYQKLKDKLQVARMNSRMVFVMGELNRNTNARRIGRQALKVLQDAGEEEEVANLKFRLATVAFKQDSFARALQLMNEVEEYYRRINDEQRLARILYSKANYAYFLEDYHDVLSQYNEAKQIFAKYGETIFVGITNIMLSHIYLKGGRLLEALEAVNEAQKVFKKLGQKGYLAFCHFNRVDILLEMNRVEEALTDSVEAQRLFRELKEVFSANHCLVQMALVLTADGEYAKANDALNKALKYFKQNKVYSLVNEIYLLKARISFKQNHYKRAENFLHKIRDQYANYLSPNAESQNLQYLAIIEIKQKRYDQSKKHLTEALNKIKTLNLPVRELRLKQMLGNCLQKMGNLDEAETWYTEAVETLERIALPLRMVEDYRISFFEDKITLYEELILLLLSKNDPISLRKAFEYVERSKSRLLVELLTEKVDWKLSVKRELPQEMLSELTRLREELRYMYREEESDDRGPDTRSPHILKQISRRKEKKEKEYLDYLRKLSLSREPIVKEAVTLFTTTGYSLPEIQRYLPENTALIEFFIAQNHIHVFILTADSFQTRRLETDTRQLAALMAKWQDHIEFFECWEAKLKPFADSQKHIAERILSQLYQQLFQPLEKALNNCENLIIIPHAFLHNIPFSLLHDGQKYLSERYTFTFLPCANVLPFLRQPKLTPPNKALIIGVSDEHTPTIPDEIKSVASLINECKVLHNEAATLQNFSAHTANWDIIHIVSHSKFRPEAPLYSYIKFWDDRLLARDLYDLDLNKAMVVVSSCEAGAYQVTGNEEIIGLTRGFLFAGVSSLIMSRWKVNDAATSQLMKQFYSSFLNEQKSPAQALSHAQLSIKEVYQHPYYWGAFYYLGNL